MNLPKYYLHLKKPALEALERRKYVSTSGINYDSEFLSLKTALFISCLCTVPSRNDRVILTMIFQTEKGPVSEEKLHFILPYYITRIQEYSIQFLW